MLVTILAYVLITALTGIVADMAEWLGKGER